MVYRRTLDSSEPPFNHDGAENDTIGNRMCNQRIAHGNTAKVDKTRFTSLCTLNIHPKKKTSNIDLALIYKRIFDAIRAIYDTATIIIPDN